jgi:hypothetical protein
MNNRQNEIETDRKINGDCCLCDGEYTFYGNNANPLAEGQCCNDCNNKVIDARFGRLQKPKLKLKVKKTESVGDIFDRVFKDYFQIINCEADRLQKIADDEKAERLQKIADSWSFHYRRNLNLN